MTTITVHFKPDEIAEIKKNAETADQSIPHFIKCCVGEKCGFVPKHKPIDDAHPFQVGIQDKKAKSAALKARKEGEALVMGSQPTPAPAAQKPSRPVPVTEEPKPDEKKKSQEGMGLW